MNEKLKSVFEQQKKFLSQFMKEEVLALNREDIRPHDLLQDGHINNWLIKMIWALKEEVKEFDSELLYKHWSHDKLDYHNLCIELVDMFCFMTNIAVILKIDADEIINIWEQKVKVNIQRQANKYNKENKTETDNKSIKVRGKTWYEWNEGF